MTLQAPLQQCEAPSTGLTGSICRIAAERSVERFGSGLRALILTGSLAREEGTFVKGARGEWAALGDAEFLLVLDSGMPLPPEAEATSLIRAIEASLSDCDISCAVSMGICHDDYLLGLRPHIFAYELACRGRVVFGEEKILSLIRPFTISEIPLEDAWRMLSNRIVEQLKLVDELIPVPEKLSVSAHYQFVKFVLDMATSFLVFAGCYAPSYRERAARLCLLAPEPADGKWPFDLAEFSRIVEACTDWKLSPGASGDARFDLWRSAVDYARKLWVWELARLTGGDVHDPAADLMARWTERQPVLVRMRGWFYVFRREGWRAGHLVSGGFLRRVWMSSPRYDVYAAASLLFFCLPELLQSDAGGAPASFPDSAEIARRLPMRSPGRESHRAGWQDLASEIVWNYNRYLVETRS